MDLGSFSGRTKPDHYGLKSECRLKMWKYQMQATLGEIHGQEEKEKNRMIARRSYRFKGGFLFFV